MATNHYDAIIVGARCAGSPTAMLLAQKGYKVLVVDKATFPSDTISTHLIHPPGAAALKRWGLLDRLLATGCPPIDTYAFDFGPFTLAGAPGTADFPVAYSPRRTVLDKLLVDAASEAGAEVREGFTVEQLLLEDGRVAGIRGHGKGGRSVTEHARVTIGADGRHSLVAAAVHPEQYQEKPRLQASYYAYWSGLPMNGRFESCIRPDRAFAAWPTNDNLTLIIAGWPYAEFEANKKDFEAHVLETLDLSPSFAERVRAARREERFAGAAVANYFRKPYGPGWALVGDAGYNKDFITAQGIQDAFRDAELCASALDESFSGARPFDVAMRDYQSTRDEQVLPIYEFTCQLAALEAPPPEMQHLLAAVHGNQEAMDGFAQTYAGVTSPAAFFSTENVARIFGVAARVDCPDDASPRRTVERSVEAMSDAFDSAEFKAKMRTEWRAAAAGWRRWHDVVEAEEGGQFHSTKLVELAGIEPGDVVLDVAGGYGEPSLTAARAVGPRGRVVCTDISPEMLAFGRERAAAAGLDTIEFVESDAEQLDFDEESFDAVLSRAGLMFLPDVAGALHRLHTFLKPGGRLAASVWGPQPTVQFTAAIPIIAAELHLPPPPPGRPGIFALADANTLAALVAAAGFREVVTGAIQVVFATDTPEKFTSFIQDVAPTIAALVDEEPPDVRERVWDKVTAGWAPFQDAEGRVRTENQAIWVVGIR